MAIAIPVKALPLSFVVHALAVAGAVLVLVWNIYFRGGLAWESTNKSLIFNAASDGLKVCNGPNGSRIVNLMSHFFPPPKQLHPVLMLIGLIIIGGEAIISYKALPFRKEEKKIIHLVLHAIALILGIIGVYAAFKYHNESSIANLYSLHSWLGIGVISLYGIQWLYGFVVFFFPGGTAAIRRESLPWHVLFGIFVYILAVATATLGYLEKLTFLENSGLAKYGSEAFLVNFTAIVTILYGTFVLLTALSQGPVEDDYSYSAI
ncbi:hypothetical protein RHSIM_Rhsim03G0180700 [Rhododendron simsii]|uniref:ascorbate ferrireductase (transmembrane) n=1 Tax=Rhododendron simsii TaxID=118357 RepID=A0A834H4F3_RHOSS|nr:hypothetical protein RHSIM_Rhsim03G0180700 [Rhododendron simsii]